MMMKKQKWIFLILFAMFVGVLSTSYVKAEDVTELAINTSATKVGTEREYELYKVDVSQTGKLNVTFRHENLYSTDTYWTVQVYAEGLEDDDLLQEFDSIGTDEVLEGPSLGLTAGTYYIKVYSRKECSHSYSESPYTVCPKFTATGNFEIEYNATSKQSNDYQGCATQISLGSTWAGTIGTSDDVDYYQFKISKKGYVTLTFSHENVYDSNTCWYAEIVNAKTGTIYRIETAGTKKKKTSPKIGLSAGTYYVKVTKGSNYSSVDYKLSVKYKKSSKWEIEYSNKTQSFNNQTKNANTLKLGKSVQGTIMQSDDIDYYTFNVKKTKNVTLSFSHAYKAKKAKFFKIEVYNEKLQLVATYYSKGVDKKITKTMKLTKGTYFVKVTQANKLNTSPYTLKVK